MPLPKRLLISAALCLGLAAPASALDLSKMTETEKTAFGEAVRAYLLEKPEVLMEAIGALEKRNDAERANADITFLRENAASIYQNPNDWAGGNLQGDITVVEFLDYRCGYCRRAWTEVEDLVKSDGNIRIVMKEFPILGEDSLASSKFAIAARRLGGDEVYKNAHDALIELKTPANDEALADVAKDLGLDFAKVKTEMESEAVAAIIRENHELATALEINGTPTFIVKETMVRGYVPLDGMRQIVDGQRKAN